MYAKMLTKQALCDAVYTVVLRSERPLSRLDICHAIGKKKSPHIIDMIEHLATTGYIIKSQAVDHRGFGYFIYSPGGSAAKEACADVEEIS